MEDPPRPSDPLPPHAMFEDMVKDYVEATGKDFETSKRKVRIFHAPRLPVPLLTFDQALARDDFRCVISGWFDRTSIRECVELQNKQQRLNGITTVTPTHILNGLATQDAQADRTAGVMAILEKLGFESLQCSGS